MLPPWMVELKTRNFGRPDGVACSMVRSRCVDEAEICSGCCLNLLNVLQVDVFYVPGRLAQPFGWLGILTASTGTSVSGDYCVSVGQGG
jgi:hypothetical protein